MPSGLGSLECNGSSLVGTFDVAGSLRFIAVNVKPPNLPFQCTSATLTYGNAAQLDGACKWTGTAGRDDLQMDFGGGVSIVGALAAPRSSMRIRGTGSWSTAEPNLPLIQANGTQSNVSNVPVSSSPPDDAVQAAAKVAREQQLINLGFPIIAIFGQSGVGKSTVRRGWGKLQRYLRLTLPQFINLIAAEQQKVGKGLQSCTSDISVIDARVGGQSVVVIDTPGFDNSRADMKDDDVLAIIAKFLSSMAEGKVYVTGVLILHHISDIALSQTAHRIAKMLGSLCGDNAMNQLMLCTTMWDTVPDDEGYDRFDELCKTDAWKEMISKGAGTAMISNVSPNANLEAEKIVSQLIRRGQPVELAIQHEMVHKKLKVAETGASRALNECPRSSKTKPKCEIEETQRRLCKDRESNAVPAQEMIQVRKAEAEILKTKAERGPQDGEKVTPEMKQHREQMRKERGPESVITAKSIAMSAQHEIKQDIWTVRRGEINCACYEVELCSQRLSSWNSEQFVNLITSEQQNVTDGLQSCTRDVSVVQARVRGNPIVVIDTPGIDDTHAGVKESDVLEKIAKCFENMGKVTGVLFLHRINDNRFSHTAQRISTMLKSLCGVAAMDQLMLCTTMWDRVPEDEGRKRFDELRMLGAWQEMILGGASVAKISNTSPNAKADAEKIVSRLIKKARPVHVAIQDEMWNQAKMAPETSAGRVLFDDQQKQAKSDKKVKETIRKIWRRIGCVIQ